MQEPLSPPEVTALLRAIVSDRTGSCSVAFTRHALREMASDDPPLTAVDVVNVLGGGVVEPGELIQGTWRYRVRTYLGLYAVVAFRSETEVAIVTAWRDRS